MSLPAAGRHVEDSRLMSQDLSLKSLNLNSVYIGVMGDKARRYAGFTLDNGDILGNIMG